MILFQLFVVSKRKSLRIDLLNPNDDDDDDEPIETLNITFHYSKSFVTVPLLGLETKKK
jgi:hypothetical protein